MREGRLARLPPNQTSQLAGPSVASLTLLPLVWHDSHPARTWPKSLPLQPGIIAGHSAPTSARTASRLLRSADRLYCPFPARVSHCVDLATDEHRETHHVEPEKDDDDRSYRSVCKPLQLEHVEGEKPGESY